MLSKNYFKPTEMRYIKHGVLLEESQEWQKELYGFETHGKGDCVFRSALGAMAYDNQVLMDSCIDLCIEKKRWPDELNHEWDYKYRSQTKMTRDGYIMTLCAQYLGCKNKHYYKTQFYLIGFPWYLYRPHIWAWRKYLITGKEKYKKRYEFWQMVSLRISSNKVYALHLVAWMCYTAKSDKVKKYMYDSGLIPSWNMLIKLLCGVSIPNSFQPKTRFQWTEETWRDGPFYDGPYQIDLDILTYILNR